MSTNNFEVFYTNIKDRIDPLLLNNPSFKNELKQIHQSFKDYRIENNGHKIVFSDCQTTSNYKENKRVIKMITISTSVGEMMISKIKNHTNVTSILPTDNDIESRIIDVFLNYTYHYFDKDGLEMERRGFSTKRQEVSDISYCLNYAMMYQMLMKYRPYFILGSIPQCQEPVDKNTTSSYRYSRSNDNLAIVLCTVNMCRDQINEKTNALYYEDDCYEQKLMLNPRDLNSDITGFFIKGQYLLSARPQYLNFNAQHLLTSDEINSGTYNAKYFLKQVEAFLGGKEELLPLYENLIRRGKEQLISEEKRLMKKAEK